MTVLDAGLSARPRSLFGALELAFGATLFLSASLLFCLEPMFSKMVLPVLGGSSSVWSVAMAVYQGLLLAGYVYAHLITRAFTLKRAAQIHVAVLALATLSLPIAINAAFHTPPQSFVSLWLIGLFVASVGLPCFALSANAPLLQAWYAQSGKLGAANPYFLYRASNLGSFAILLSYPVFIEPAFGLAQQSRLWSVGYAALLAVLGACGLIASRGREGAPVSRTFASAQKISAKDRALWTALGFIPSGLLVAVTAHIATDVASGPFLWIPPLAFYLLTFVLVFSDRPVVPSKWMLALQPASLGVLAVLLLWTARMNWGLAFVGHLFVFFTAAMVCHARLYRTRPEAGDLTEFYAYVSLGGVLGGIFAALIAPLLFKTVLEYPLLAFLALFARSDVWRASRARWLGEILFASVLAGVLVLLMTMLHASAAVFAISVMAVAAFLALQTSNAAKATLLAGLLLAATSLYDPSQSVIAEARSFYGVYKVVSVEGGKYRVLFHGTTAHGAEQVRGDTGSALTGAPDPLTYYHRGGSYAQALEAVRARNSGRLDHVALVGLGVGALTCYAKPGEHWTIYELDPLVVQMARNRDLFRSLATCAANMPVVIGDGRLTLQGAKAPIDLLILDIFSSDSVPTHMLTKEAFALFKSKLAPHGAIAFNISNHNMALASVVAASAAANGMATAVRTDTRPPPQTLKLPAEIAVVARSPADLAQLKLGPGWHIVQPTPGMRAWSDDYSDILGAILRRMRGAS
jgi:spermidine synthase